METIDPLRTRRVFRPTKPRTIKEIRRDLLGIHRSLRKRSGRSTAASEAAIIVTLVIEQLNLGYTRKAGVLLFGAVGSLKKDGEWPHILEKLEIVQDHLGL